MWFKKKIVEKKPSWKVKALEGCMAFRAIGEKFNYMGVEMLVTKHGTINWELYTGMWVEPDIHADYVNKHGDVKSVVFSYHELETLRKENPENGE